MNIVNGKLFNSLSRYSKRRTTEVNVLRHEFLVGIHIVREDKRYKNV